MVPPPKRVDAVNAQNNTAHPLKFTVVYDNHKDKTEITETLTVQPGQAHVFAAKELDMGSWSAVAPVVRVQVDGPSGKSHSLTPQVGGIVPILAVTATDAAGGVALSQH
ncbi:hypothetical protein HXX76_015270 [Chlamydomonas incerta]|uniref:Uncharacterized protein n=1 Tax=Chlamydomonas incerta TaxID=51695 RepID=A0A835VNN2_CHLIN|nr:hypothetical protein HXX76_015270 [Chlamydomonas incerta]|eukprot:KAG2423522.1 hypothetical protein HXX76_015270 [Chlamydomonas incerta]